MIVHVAQGRATRRPSLRALGELEGVTVRSALACARSTDECVVQADVVGEAGADLEAELAPIADLDEVDEPRGHLNRAMRTECPMRRVRLRHGTT